ncbi:MAG: hypothetical protein AABX65_02280, partial [Nanoarchaeota archaeon]
MGIKQNLAKIVASGFIAASCSSPYDGVDNYFGKSNAGFGAAKADINSIQKPETGLEKYLATLIEIYPDEPKKFPKVVQRYSDSSPVGQDVIRTTQDAESLYNGLQQNLLEHGLDLTKNLKVLEVGSGNAVFLDYLKEQGVDAVGVDVKPRGGHESPQVIARIE